MTASLYIYYKATTAPDVAARVRAMQADLSRRSGIQGKLMRRRDAPDTWMEVYEAVGSFETFEAVLSEAVTHHRLEELLPPGERRHLERFVAA